MDKTLYQNVIASYKKPFHSFYYPSENNLNINLRDEWKKDKTNSKTREGNSLKCRQELASSQKFFLDNKWVKHYEKYTNDFSIYDLTPAYDNMWIEFNVNQNDYDIPKEIQTQNFGYHIVKIRTAKSKNRSTELGSEFDDKIVSTYLLTPYRTTLYNFDIHKEEPNMPIKILAPLYSVLFSLDVPLTNLGNERETTIKPLNYREEVDKVIWGDNYNVRDVENLKNHFMVCSSRFGMHYDSICNFRMNDDGSFTTPEDAIIEFEILNKKHNIEYNSEELFQEHMHQSMIPMDSIMTSYINIMVYMNCMKEVKEIKNNRNAYERNTPKIYHTFKTLTVDPTIIRKHSDKKYFYEGHKNRYHSVRGHWRNYKSGKRIWINNFDRGDESLGVIEKQYKVVGH